MVAELLNCPTGASFWLTNYIMWLHLTGILAGQARKMIHQKSLKPVNLPIVTFRAQFQSLWIPSNTLKLMSRSKSMLKIIIQKFWADVNFFEWICGVQNKATFWVYHFIFRATRVAGRNCNKKMRHNHKKSARWLLLMWNHLVGREKIRRSLSVTRQHNKFHCYKYSIYG